MPAAVRPRPDTSLVRRARKINRVLAETYPEAHCELDFEDAFQLLVVTVLSAQTTVLATRRSLFDVRNRRLAAVNALLKNVAGPWDGAQPEGAGTGSDSTTQRRAPLK